MLEVAGYRYHANKDRPVLVGDVVSFQPEPSNEKDPNAVMVCVGDHCICYVNRLQASGFQRWLKERQLEASSSVSTATPTDHAFFFFVRVMPSSSRQAAA